MRSVLACLLFAATPALAQVPAMKAVPTQGACADCGVVRSVKLKQKEIQPAAETAGKPSGLVATIPFGKGAEKPTIGSSTRVGKDVIKTSDTWEVTLRLDDGRMRVLVVDEDPDLREGDKVRVDANGKIQRRTD
jgi:outer membrane lipoprotein SlyB